MKPRERTQFGTTRVALRSPPKRAIALMGVCEAMRGAATPKECPKLGGKGSF